MKGGGGAEFKARGKDGAEDGFGVKLGGFSGVGDGAGIMLGCDGDDVCHGANGTGEAAST
jgi:hypothetical protein